MKQKQGMRGFHAVLIHFEKWVEKMLVQNVVKYPAAVVLAVFYTYHSEIPCPFKVYFAQLDWLFSIPSLVVFWS